jgi:enterochelin esterase-like enzyme
VNTLLDIGILSGPAVIAVFSLAAVTAALLILVRPSTRWRRSRWLLTALISAVAGGAAGAGLTWLLADAMHLFGVDLTIPSRLWIAAACAGIAVALTSLFRATWRRVVAAALAIIVFVTAGAMGVNIAFGQFPTVRSALGLSAFAGDPLPTIASGAADRPTIANWTAPADLPANGAMASVSIPPTKSGFAARNAVVYVPPAALTANPPLLPVLVIMSGQPGTPDDPFTTAHFRETLDAYAAAHQGLAPIVVSPDQLGSPDANPMCVDSPLGNSATYLTVDVPAWITANLPVLPSPTYWGIGGMSQGGTCSIQLGAQHPELFGAILDASGEEFPTLGDPTTTTAKAFGGDPAAYAAAYPAAIMAAHAPYADTIAVFGAGSEDTAYRPGVETLYGDALDAGMDATYVESEGSAHDATSWSYVFTQGLDLIAERWGLNR